ncbi:MAG: response regulator [bacterium]|nr:response regulator [bacterium]
MPQWQTATAIGIAFLVALTTHVFYRRPPTALWPALPLVFSSALVFSIGDLLAGIWSDNPPIRWAGMLMVYTGLLSIAPGWWLFTRGFSKMMGYRKVAFRSGLPILVAINTLLWIGLLTNPWHGQFLEVRALTRSEYGPLWYATASVNYGALVMAMIVHARGGRFVQDPTIRSQTHFLVAAVAIPMLMNMAYVFSPVVFSYDPTALGYALSCALFLFAVERRDLFVLERVSLPSVLDHDADPILIVSPHRQLIYANPNAERLFGEGVLMPGAPVGDLLERAVPNFSLVKPKRRRDWAEEHRFTSVSGREHWVVIDVSVVQKSRGVEAGLCLRIRDRTALREAQNEAEEHFALLEALDFAIGEGILVQERSGKVRYVNEAFARIWGMTPQRMIDFGRGLDKYLESALAEPSSRAIRQLLHGSVEQFDAVSREKSDVTLFDGRVYEVTTLPIQTDAGFSGRAWRMSDVTQARRESQAMIQSQKLEGLGILAGGIAHDFNNLLMTVLGNTEIARGGLEPDSELQYPLADVEAAAKSASELTSQLLSYAGKTTFMKESVDLSVLLRDVTSLMSVSIPKNIDVKLSLQDGIPLVHGGPAQLRQVMMNLVSNAADAIGERDGKIVIDTGLGRPDRMVGADASVEHGEVSGDVVYLTVRDNGAGMSAATLDKIFDPFFTTKFAGRGLGLAATRGILESHDGLLRIETTLGVGSAFSMLLPVRVLASPATLGVDGILDSSEVLDRRVLIVDDEEAIRKILTKRLTNVGFEVDTASNGEEALGIVAGIGPALDLVILDITMPGLSGIETWTQIREIQPELPIIMSSGHPEEALERLDGWDDVRDGFIQKPYLTKALLATIEPLLKVRPS